MVGVTAQDVGGCVKVVFQFALRHPARRTDDDGGLERFKQLF